MAIGARIRRVLATFQLAALMFYYEAMTVGFKKKKITDLDLYKKEREKEAATLLICVRDLSFRRWEERRLYKVPCLSAE
jgi:hypothetical protein